MPPRKNAKEVWSNKDCRGPADKSSYVGSDTGTKNVRDKVLGLRPKAQNPGGVQRVRFRRHARNARPVLLPRTKSKAGALAAPLSGQCHTAEFVWPAHHQS
jgi:hypothetical protein